MQAKNKVISWFVWVLIAFDVLIAIYCAVIEKDFIEACIWIVMGIYVMNVYRNRNSTQHIFEADHATTEDHHASK